MKSSEITLIVIVVIAVAVFAIWGAREIRKNNIRDFGAGGNKGKSVTETKQYSIDEIASEIK